MWFYIWTSWEGKIKIARIVQNTKDKNFFCTGKCGFLEDIYVDSNYRRKGIAKRFFNLVAKEVVKNNGSWLKLNGIFLSLIIINS